MTVIDRWHTVKRVVASCLELGKEERETYLVRVCGTDATLRKAVETLLDVSSQRIDAMESFGIQATTQAPEREAGDRIDSFQIEKHLKTGGMGAVYLARDLANDRDVALKLLSSSADLLLGEEHKLQARLEHPNIARLYASGRDRNGTRYLAVEYVDGPNIVEHCDHERLPLRERLKLFHAVCEAVEAAHQHFLVHGDIKPDNIIVDRSGRPKLIDFGIAHDLSAHESQEDYEESFRPATVAFASPEQLGHEEMTPASDTYSLGVLLCVLTTGRLPHEADTQTGLIEAIRNSHPLLPSQLAMKGRNDLAPAFTLRRRWRASAGDIDAIARKALQRNPADRYGSTAALGEDSQRFLSGEPVHARDGGTWYRTRKLITRHLGAVTALAAVVVTLVTAVVLVLAQNRVATAERDRAEQEAERAQEVNDFLIDVFEVSDPRLSPDRELTARDLLDRAAERVDGELASDPIRRATLMEALADSYISLGHSDVGLNLYQRIVELRTEHLGAMHPHVALALSDLAGAHLGLGSWAEGSESLKRALEIQEANQGLIHEDTATTINNLGAAHYYLGNLKVAEARYRQALEIRLELLGENNRDTAGTLNNLGILLRKTGRLEEATEMHQRTLAIKKAILDPEHPSIGTSLNSLAAAYRDLGRLEESTKLRREDLALSRSIFGDENPRTARSRANLAVALEDAGDLVAAAELQREALTALQAWYSEPHPQTAVAMANLGSMLGKRGLWEESEQWRRAALTMREKIYEPEHEAISDSLHGMGVFLSRRGRWDESESFLQRALTIRERALGTPHLSVASTLAAIAYLEYQQGKIPEAITRFGSVLGMRRTLLPDDHPLISRTLVQLADAEVEVQQLDLARAHFQDGLGGLRQAKRERSPEYLAGLLSYANLLLFDGDVQTAESLISEATQHLEDQVDGSHLALAIAKSLTGACRSARRQFQDAQLLLVGAQADIAANPGAGATQNHRARERIVRLYEAWGRSDLAAEWQRESLTN